MENNKEVVTETEKKEVPTPAPKAPVVTDIADALEDKWSAERGELVMALSKAQGEMANGSKAKEGYNYKYMELPVLLDIVRPVLAKYGLAVVQTHALRRGARPSVVTTSHLLHSSGQWLETKLDIPIEAKKGLSPAQVIGVASTYARRYALQALMGIGAENDTDGRA